MDDLNDKVTGGTLSASEWDQVASELQNVIEALGITLSGTDLHQLSKAIAGYAGASTWYSESGAADAYVLTPIGSKKGMTALDTAHDGYECRFRPGNANTGASTVNVNSLGVKSIVREDLSALQSGDLITTRDAVIRYRQTGDHWVLASYVIAGTLAVPRGYIDGFITSQAADTDHDINFWSGVARDEADSDTMSLSSVLVKQIDVNWAVGTNNGGFPSGLSLSANTWYHLFVIKNISTGVVDAGFDTSLSAANLQSDTGWGANFIYRRVGSVKTDSSSNIIAYLQRGDRFIWSAPVNDVRLINPGTSVVTHTLPSVPSGLVVGADVTFNFRRPNSEPATYYTVAGGGESLAGTAPQDIYSEGYTQGDSRGVAISIVLMTDTAQHVKSRQSDSDSSASCNIFTHGWYDFRGKE